MKVQIVSDLHLEFLSHEEVVEVASKICKNSFAEVLVLAGDICSLASHSLRSFYTFITCIEDTGSYSDIIYVLGNHEYYGTSPIEVSRVIKNLTTYRPHLHILENDYRTLENVTFYGTTLWFKENVDTSIFRNYLNDYRCIQDFTPDTWSRKAIEFIKSIPDDESKKVLITHHVPHSRFISPSYVGNDMNCFYLNEVGNYLNKFDLVTFGHSHESVDYLFSDRCRARSNPRGYADENNQGSNNRFQYQLIVEV